MNTSVLALDYGDVTIGVAVSDSSERYALAHGIVPSKPEHEAIAAIVRIIEEEQARQIVIGMPFTLTGERGVQAKRTETFISALQSKTNVPIETIDERFSTTEAQRYAREKNTPVDAEAARLLLETWLSARQKR